MYDGFISYSHAADGQLAPHLQAGLQRFAKPWWQRRALRIFRDESSLAANPHLWDSITDALDESEWFVLLLSPDAADSEWVNNEVAYWVEHKDAGRIIPVVTAGEFHWDGSDVAGDCVPAPLGGVFGSEPRWVDARGLGDPATLDLQNPGFAAVVADLAAPLRGVPKDELAGEEVRQHKRTVRTAWAAGLVVAALAVVSASLALVAFDQRSEAERQADIAAVNAQEAERQAQIATENADEALREKERADKAASDQLEYVVGRQPDNPRLPTPPPFNPTAVEFEPPAYEIRNSPPPSTRLDFLPKLEFETGGFVRPSYFVDETLGIRQTSQWLGNEAFHIRHGFPVPEGTNPEEMLVAGYDLALIIRPEIGQGPGGLLANEDESYRFYADFVVVEESADCGRDHELQREPVPCLRFVHNFPEGMGDGRYELWLAWEAPCASWLGEVCTSPSRVLNLFDGSAEISFWGPTFEPEGGFLIGGWSPGCTFPESLPEDPWFCAEPIP